MTLSISSKFLAAAALAVSTLGAATTAHARSDVYFSIGVQPQPVYVQPAPVYVEPQPVHVRPRPVYVQPAPVYAPRPVFVVPRGFEGGYRDRDDWRRREWHHRHWREHERHGRD